MTNEIVQNISNFPPLRNYLESRFLIIIFVTYRVSIIVLRPKMKRIALVMIVSCKGRKVGDKSVIQGRF